jgi:hypothetical protein
MQTVCPSNIQGVPVSIDAIDPNGNPVHIGSTTSDMSGTYSFTWAPTIPGNYQITATFAGTNSYGSSYAETHANVVSATTSSTTPTQATNNQGQTSTDSLMMTLIAGIIVIIIAIAVVGVLLLRKK